MNAIENNLFNFDIAVTDTIQNSNLQKIQEIEINKL